VSIASEWEEKSLCENVGSGERGFAARCGEGLRPSVAGRQCLDFYKPSAQPLEKAVFT
jgi:hypothetical protein